MGNQGFFGYLVEKIKENKDIISLIISFCIFMQAVLFLFL